VATSLKWLSWESAENISFINFTYKPKRRIGLEYAKMHLHYIEAWSNWNTDWVTSPTAHSLDTTVTWYAPVRFLVCKAHHSTSQQLCALQQSTVEDCRAVDVSTAQVQSCQSTWQTHCNHQHTSYTQPQSHFTQQNNHHVNGCLQMTASLRDMRFCQSFLLYFFAFHVHNNQVSRPWYSSPHYNSCGMRRQLQKLNIR